MRAADERRLIVVDAAGWSCLRGIAEARFEVEAGFSSFASPLPARSLGEGRFDLPGMRLSVVRPTRALERGQTVPRPSVDRCRAAEVVHRFGFEAATQAPPRLVSSIEVGA